MVKKNKSTRQVKSKRLRSPNRLDLDSSTYELRPLPEALLSSEQFDKIEWSGRVKLDARLRAEINNAIELFITFKFMEAASFKRRLVDQEIKKFQKAVSSLSEFLQREETTVSFAVRRKVDDILCAMNYGMPYKKMDRPLMSEKRKWGTYRIFDGEKSRSKVDLDRLQMQMKHLEAAVLQASKEYQEGKDDKGGDEAMLTRTELVRDLDNIFKSAGGKSIAFDRFLHSVIECVPKQFRPRISDKLESNRKLVTRVRKKR